MSIAIATRRKMTTVTNKFTAVHPGLLFADLRGIFLIHHYEDLRHVTHYRYFPQLHTIHLVVNSFQEKHILLVPVLNKEQLSKLLELLQFVKKSSDELEDTEEDEIWLRNRYTLPNGNVYCAIHVPGFHCKRTYKMEN